MNHNHLAMFHAVAEAGSFTKAAERLYISQPALSQQVGQLESTLGVKLFDRLPRGVRLTHAGQILANHAARMEALDQQAQRQIRELRGLARGRLTIGASQTIGVYLMPEILGRFRRVHPQIDLDLQIANTEVIQQKLADDSSNIPTSTRRFSSKIISSPSSHPAMLCWRENLLPPNNSAPNP
jgi:DNA-binding transcriptional LysR family regulator